MNEKDDMILERISRGCCPVCGKPFDNMDDVTTTDYNGSDQPVHKRHIMFQSGASN